MSVNTSHANNGVVIYAGEVIILYCDHVKMELSKAVGANFSGSKTGRLYLTSHRIIFTNSSQKDMLKSFAAPFFALHKVELEQPVFGANYIKGEVKGQPNGGFDNKTVEIKLTFKHGGAIEFGQAMLKVASMASRHTAPTYRDCPPPYSAPSMPFVPAPPPAYAPPTQGYYGWVPPTNVFPQRPPTDGVYTYDAPPPYPGIYGPPPQQQQQPAGGAVGFTAPQTAYGVTASAADAKAHEASQPPHGLAYCDPNQPNHAYVAPPPYNEQPPPYDSGAKKTN